jgi:hypothetical protein
LSEKLQLPQTAGAVDSLVIAVIGLIHVHPVIASLQGERVEKEIVDAIPRLRGTVAGKRREDTEV